MLVTGPCTMIFNSFCGNLFLDLTVKPFFFSTIVLAPKYIQCNNVENSPEMQTTESGAILLNLGTKITEKKNH